MYDVNISHFLPSFHIKMCYIYGQFSCHRSLTIYLQNKQKKYNELVNNEKNIFFGGRLGEYKYYDMDNTIFNAIKMYEKVSKIL